jgi:hypothetical protein
MFNDPEARRAVAALADSWLMLAAQRVKNIEKARRNGEPKQNSSRQSLNF